MIPVGKGNESNRFIWVENKLANLPSGLSILDAGAGEQRYKKHCKHLKYVSQDFAQYDGIGNKKGLQTKKWDYSKLDIVSDITKIPVDDETFDVVLCSEVFEHIPEPVLAIKEFRRLLKQRDGILILTAPFCSLTHFAPHHYSAGYNRYFYEKHLKENGFRIVEMVSNGNFFEYIAQEIRRIQKVANQYSHCNPTYLERVAIRFILKMLARFSEKDKGSEELLCFGYQILARKR